MSDYDYNDKALKGKGRYYLIFGLATTFAIATYMFFRYQPPTYQSSGKFAVFLNNTSAQVINFQSNTDVTKSVAESIKSRYFLEQLSEASSVTFDKKSLDSNIDNIITTDVVTNSNIIKVEIYNKSTGDLEKINTVFVDQLNSSKIFSDKNSIVEVKVIDPLYTSDQPTYPQPLKFALVAFFSIIVLGFLLNYSVEI